MGASDLLSNLIQQCRQLYSKLLPIPCRLCGAYSQAVICADCQHDFPTLGHACPRCATPMSQEHQCGQCLNHPPEQDLSLSLFPYTDPIDRLIIDFKYHDKLYLSPFFAEHMAQRVQQQSLPDCLVPIPLHPRRLRQRGYNQSVELSKALSQRLAIPYQHLLIRTRDTPPQASLPYADRKHNIRSAFELADIDSIPPHIALIDDVLTTGHTVNAAAKLLRQAGATTIEVWTIARTLQHP